MNFVHWKQENLNNFNASLEMNLFPSNSMGSVLTFEANMASINTRKTTIVLFGSQNSTRKVQNPTWYKK